MYKRLLIALLLAAVLLQGFAFATVDADMPETIEYAGGGIIERYVSPRMARALISELDVAYIEADDPFLTVGEETTWTVYAMGGDGLYSYQFGIYYREGTEGSFTRQSQQAYSADNSFSYVVEKSGHYVIMLYLKDSSGQSIEYQSQIFESASADDYDDETTVAGKVKALAAQCLAEAGKSDYARALWLHDWLIYNAEYDTGMSYFYADGVLLQNKGVCQSYALAYQMLLREVGIESIYITGTAGGIAHGWNLVKMGGEWYHVDCTWDDPIVKDGNGVTVTGSVSGGEQHSYFGLTDEQMAKDHVWPAGGEADPNRDWSYMPDCTATEYNYLMRSGAVLVNDQTELEAAFAKVMTERQPYAHFIYTGTDASYAMGNELIALIAAEYEGGTLQSYSYNGTTADIHVALGHGGNIIVTNQPLSLDLVVDQVLLDVGEEYIFDLEYMPRYAITAMTDNGDGTASVIWDNIELNHSEVVWESDADVLTIENGEAKAVSVGETVVTASYGVYAAHCRVKVFPEDTNRITIPAGTAAIEEEAFLNCANITSVVIPSGTAASIGRNAFDGCYSLRYIEIPADVASIDALAFGGETYTTIICEEDSAAHIFAQEHGMPYKLV